MYGSLALGSRSSGGVTSVGGGMSSDASGSRPATCRWRCASSGSLIRRGASLMATSEGGTTSGDDGSGLTLDAGTGAAAGAAATAGAEAAVGAATDAAAGAERAAAGMGRGAAFGGEVPFATAGSFALEAAAGRGGAMGGLVAPPAEAAGEGFGSGGAFSGVLMTGSKRRGRRARMEPGGKTYRA